MDAPDADELEWMALRSAFQEAEGPAQGERQMGEEELELELLQQQLWTELEEEGQPNWRDGEEMERQQQKLPMVDNADPQGEDADFAMEDLSSGSEGCDLQSSRSGNCRKRLWANGDSQMQSKILEQTAFKRSRAVECVTLDHSELDKMKNRPPTMEDPVEEWLPPPPSLLNRQNCHQDRIATHTNIAESISNYESKLPRKRADQIQGEFMFITGPSGERVYTEVRRIQSTSGRLHNVYGDSRRSDNGLLSEPFELLMEKAEQRMLQQACHATTEEDSLDHLTSDTTTHEQLWVEKYAPKSFTELLSHEQTNREVLRWLKQWDPCVFGEKKTSTSVDVLSALRRQIPGSQSRGFAAGKNVSFNGQGRFGPGNQHLSGKGNGEWSLINPSSSWDSTKSLIDILAKGQPARGQPDEKILLLCGPPGLGKTTLAHVAAKHCGYRVVEINASDDRVATTLQAKILDAVQMKSVMGDSRPNCLVIDEIDGALGNTDGKSAIDSLLKIAYAERKQTYGKENEPDILQPRKASKTGASTSSRLSRPVICICNDLYAPALRSLRQVARVHVFVQPSANRVVTRLKYICNKEGYKANARALTALAEHTECDIRSCLNTLQFLKRKREPLKMLDIASQVVGRKDMTSSAFDIWGEVFQKRKSRPGAAVRGLGKFDGQEHKDFLRLHELIANHGEYELTFEGIHDNLLQMRYHDSGLHKTVHCLELLSDSELLSHQVLRAQHFFLNGYQPTIALAIRSLVAQPEKPKIEWPRTFQRFRTEYAARKELLKLWMNLMQPMVSRALSAGSLAQDVVSSLLYILAPQTLRPVAPQLLSPSERAEISQLVDTMIMYGVTYKNAKSGISFMEKQEFDLEQKGFILEPPINKLVKFKEYTSGHRLLTSTLQQVLCHEVELEIIRRESIARSERAMVAAAELQTLMISDLGSEGQNKHTASKCFSTVRPSVSSREESGKVDSDGAVKVPGMRPMARQVKPEVLAKQGTDFFERFKKTSEKSTNSEREVKMGNTLASRDARPLLYKYHEGFTNAIRRPALVRDFL